VMKLCAGGSLTRWLRPEHRQSPEQIRLVGVRIADALAAAHARGMLHRDVKPANILIDSYGNAGLADFGLATASEQSAATAITPAYAPPETFRRQPATEYGDVYQLAATLYALLSGRPPREPIGGRTSLDDLVARLDEPVEPLPGVDKDLMQVLLDGMAAVPTNRPTAAEFRDRLTAIDLSGNVRAGSVALPVPHRGRRLVLNMVVAAVATLLVVALGGSAVYLYEVDRSVTANIIRGIELSPEVGPSGQKRPVKDPEADQTLDYVLIGTDDDPEFDDEGRSDSIMLVHLNQSRDEAYVMSFPRDTPVTIPGQRGKQRITEAYRIGGAPLVVETLEELTGTRMDHVAMIDFQGFVTLTDDLGGITVRNSTPFQREGFYYARGEIPLTGRAALEFLRGRPSEQLRAENHRNVLKAILAKALSAEVVSDPFKFTKFVGNAAKRIRVDNSLSDSELRSTALSLRLGTDDITLLSAPVSRKTNVPRIDHDKLAALGPALRKDKMADYVKEHGER
jgi:LCP family protein required for cell wall assembly